METEIVDQDLTIFVDYGFYGVDSGGNGDNVGDYDDDGGDGDKVNGEEEVVDDGEVVVDGVVVVDGDVAGVGGVVEVVGDADVVDDDGEVLVGAVGGIWVTKDDEGKVQSWVEGVDAANDLGPMSCKVVVGSLR